VKSTFTLTENKVLKRAKDTFSKITVISFNFVDIRSCAGNVWSSRPLRGHDLRQRVAATDYLTNRQIIFRR